MDVAHAGPTWTATARGLVGSRVRLDASTLDANCTCGSEGFCEHAAALALLAAQRDDPPGEGGEAEAHGGAGGGPAPCVPAGPDVRAELSEKSERFEKFESSVLSVPSAPLASAPLASVPLASAAPPARLASVLVARSVGPGRLALAPPAGEVVSAEAGTVLRWFWWSPRGDGAFEGDSRTLARAAAMLLEGGVALAARASSAALAGARAGFHQRALGEDVHVEVADATGAPAIALAARLAQAGARPAPGAWPPTLWAVPEAAFAPWLLQCLAEGASVAPDATLNPRPLRGVTVLLDVGCLPARLREEGEGEPVRSEGLVRALASACRGAPALDAENGHVLVPAARVVEVEETLRGLGADVAFRRLAPANARFLEWRADAPEDATGARPRPRPAFRGALDRPVPGLREGVRLEGYQGEGVAFILHHGHSCLLADEMGLGKTLEAAAAAQFLPGRVLVVCPAGARTVWKGEVEKFTTERAHVLGPGATSAVPGDAKYVIVSYDGLRRHAPALDAIPFDLAILDESHYVKNGDAGRSRAAREHVLRVPRRLVISGTPVMNTPSEIRAQLAFLHPDEWSDAAWFAKRFEEPFEGGTPEVREAILARLRAYLEGVMLRREKRVALPDLPAKRVAWERVDLPPDALALYRAMEDEFRSFVAGGVAASSAKAAGKMERLKQAALSGKMRAALAFVEERLEAGDKVVVFSKYRDALASAATELARWHPAVVTGSTPPPARAEAARRLQEDDACRVFLGQLVAAGTALTLTAATRCVFLDLDWNPANHRQAMDRIHRRGQTKPVTVHFFLACGTIDEDIEAVLEEKGRMMDALLDGTSVAARGEEKDARRAVAERIVARVA